MAVVHLFEAIDVEQVQNQRVARTCADDCLADRLLVGTLVPQSSQVVTRGFDFSGVPLERGSLVEIERKQRCSHQWEPDGGAAGR